MTNQHRSTNAIVADLESLSQENGFVYTFCLVVLQCLWIEEGGDVADIDWTERPNSQELSFLLGLMVKEPLNLGFIPSARTASDQRKRCFDLFQELQASYLPRLSTSQAEGAVNEDWRGEVDVTIDDWLTSSPAMVESIFYGVEGAFDFQYLEMAKRKYAHDLEWIESHLGVSLYSIIEIATQLKSLIEARVQSIEMSVPFEVRCERLFAAFSFTPKDIPEVAPTSVCQFLQAFSHTPGGINQELGTLGAYNTVHSHPVVHLDADRYFLPIVVNLPKAIYESPFYWMYKDDTYRATAEKNRGNASEEIAYEMLKRVFGEDNVYRQVNVRTNSRNKTDIDGLACMTIEPSLSKRNQKN